VRALWHTGELVFHNGSVRPHWDIIIKVLFKARIIPGKLNSIMVILYYVVLESNRTVIIEYNNTRILAGNKYGRRVFFMTIIHPYLHSIIKVIKHGGKL
jgi:hypothetical protein